MATTQSIKERFERYVERIPFLTCWIWAGYCDKDGYGMMVIKRASGKSLYRPVGAHRISWELHRGEIPAGMHVLHNCDNPPCCNPAHLYLGGVHENVRDRVVRLREHGERNPFHKLTVAEVVRIRSFAPSWATAVALAQELGVTPENVSMVMLRKTWKHIP